MLKTLFITLTNGETAPTKWAKVFIHATKGSSIWSTCLSGSFSIGKIVFQNGPPRSGKRPTGKAESPSA